VRGKERRVRQLETVTLHFDLGHLRHLPVHQQQFTLRALGKHAKLKSHTHESRRHHAQRNAALSHLSAEQLAQLSHYAEDVELPADAVGFHWVGYPSSRPDAVADEIAVVFQHVPGDAVRQAVRAMRRDGSVPIPMGLKHFGVTALADGVDVEELHVHASHTINYKHIAFVMLMQHPEIGTLAGDLHYLIQQLIDPLPTFYELYQYLSAHPDGWYVDTYVTDPDGNVMEPVELLDDKGDSVWKTVEIDGRDVSVIPQYLLSEGLDRVLTPAVQEAGREIKQKPWLKGQQWTTQHGVTQVSRTDVVPTQQPRAEVPTQPNWTVVSRTSQYGLALYHDSIHFDGATNTLAFNVKNWPNRGLGVHVQFVDPDGRPIMNPSGFRDRLEHVSAYIRAWLQPNGTKKYLQHIGAGTVFFGAPVWAAEVPISFEVPSVATGVNVLVGGLGNGNWDLDVDKVGIIYTCVVSYGIPSLLSAMSVGVQSTKWYTDFFSDSENVLLLVAASFAPFGALLGVGSATIGVEPTLIKAAQFVSGILFSKALKMLASQLTGFVTAAEIAQNAPFVGWALKVAGQAAAISSMLATSIEVGLSPATYVLQAKRSMVLNVSVTPDPTHGTATEAPIWPKVSDHYVIDVKFEGGTTLTKTGPMPGRQDAPITVSYSKATDDPVPSAPGQRFQIVANIYSASNWLCGKWMSGWIEAVPNDGESRNEGGPIIEQLVPLVPSTQYTRQSKLAYDGPSRSYLWQRTLFTLGAQLAPSLVEGPVKPAVSEAFWAHGVRLSGSATVACTGLAGPWRVIDHATSITYEVTRRTVDTGSGYVLAVANTTEPAPRGTVASLPGQDVQGLVDITINNLAYKLGYCYLAKNQDLPLDDGADRQSSAMYVMENVSTLADPGTGRLAPSRGLSVQPYIAYDQFGPSGLFGIEPAEQYVPALDKGGPVPDAVSKIFRGQGFPLPDGLHVKTVTAGASWELEATGKPPSFVLRRQVDVIKVFHAPTPAFSANNFFLDTRSYPTTKLSQLRQVDLSDAAPTMFRYDSKQSWGAFGMQNLSAVAVHPDGYVIAISYRDDKMAILELPAAGVPDADAPQALPFCGKGVREGLLDGPIGMTVAADGRVLVLERTNGRIQAFDTRANPVQCFSTAMTFSVPANFVNDLDHATPSAALLQELQKNVPVKNTRADAYDQRYLLTPVFSMSSGLAGVLDAGAVTVDLSAQFDKNALPLGSGVTILRTAPGLWLLRDPANGVDYDIRLNGESLGKVDVYRCFTPIIVVKSVGREWTAMDKTNTLTFNVTAPQGSQGPLRWRNMSSLMPLKDGNSSAVTYLDVAVETKGFIYVLSYLNQGNKPTDYRLDIYHPDGTPLTAGKDGHNGQVNAARLVVDQWRTVFTLDYDQLQGPAGRPAPTVSQWIPSTPTTYDEGAAMNHTDNRQTLVAGELAAVRAFLRFQGAYDFAKVADITSGAINDYFGHVDNLAASYPGIRNASWKAWYDKLFELFTKTSDFAEIYQVIQFARWTNANRCKPPTSYPDAEESPPWNSFWYAFRFDYAWSTPWYGTDMHCLWARGQSSPAQPSAWHDKVDGVIKEWGDTPPSGKVFRGPAFADADQVIASASKVLNGWSGFPAIVRSTTAIAQAQLAEVKALLGPETLGDDTYFFLLHLLIGLPTGDTSAMRLAQKLINADAISQEYPNARFINQLVYSALLYLADPFGSYCYNHQQLQAMVADLANVIVSTDPASALIKTSLLQQGKLLNADASYPMQDPYTSIGFSQRKADTLAALDDARRASAT
jgi:hypothetical protein